MDRTHTALASRDVAIIGMACLFPKAPSLAHYWANILNKVDGVGEPSPEWGAARYLDSHDPAGGRIYTTAGGFLGDLYRFDPAEFGIMPSALDGSEPDQFLALKVARDALLDAGYLSDAVDHTNTGVILGHSTYLHRAQATMVQHGVVLDQTVQLLQCLWPELPAAELDKFRALVKAKLPAFNTDTAPGVVPNVMTGRIANRLDLKGPNYLIDAACASSLLAVNAAIEELRTGRSDLMLAGGVNASVPAEVFVVFSQLQALSRQSRIRPFDAGSDGTLLGEGLGVVVLKRLADARRDNDRIYAVVKGVGQSSDGRGLGLLAPRLEGEILAIQRAYQETGLDPLSVSLLEAHGTGIPLGDKTELTALTQVMGRRGSDLPRCALGSVKSMISHCIPAAGIAGLIKSALALYHKVLPPTLCNTVNPALEIDKTPFYVNTEASPWVHREDAPRRAGVDAFGFGGVNTHAILEEPPATASQALAPWNSELILLAAATRARLGTQIGELTGFVRQAQENADDTCFALRDIAYTLAQANTEGVHRLAIVASDLEDLLKKLERAGAMLQDPERHSIQTRSGIYFTDQPLAGKMAFLFPGEGSQYPAMLLELALHVPLVRQWFDFWDTIYQDKRGYFPSQTVFRPPTGLDKTLQEKLDQALYELEIGSESVFIANQALFSLLTELGLQPDMMVGHSSGENAAMVAAGVVQLNDRNALRQQILRLNEMYHKIVAAGAVASGALLTVGAVEREKILAVVAEAEGQLHLALDNCQHQAVLFGAKEDLEPVAAKLRQEGGLCTYLPIDRAYHTPLFEPVSQAIEGFFKEVPFGKANTPLYSCASVDVFPQAVDEIRHLAAVQWSSCVRFIETIQRMYADGARIFVEVGPSANLTGFVQDILRDRTHLAVASNHRNRPALQQLLHLLARLFVHDRFQSPAALFRGRQVNKIDWQQWAKPQKRAYPLNNTLPFVQFDSAELAEIRAVLQQQLQAQPAAAAPSQAPVQPALPAVSEPMDADVPATPYDAQTELLQQHLHLMQEFLYQQERIMDANLGMTQERQWPFVARLLTLEADTATAQFDLDVAEQRFLQEHILYAAYVSDLDPALHGLSVAPLTVSLEMLAEIAAVLSTKPCLNALENIRAYNWVAVDEGHKTITLTARRGAATATTERFHAALYEGEQLLLEGEVVFSDAALDAQPLLPPLAAPQPPQWQDHQLYTTGMFHGPLYHSVAHLSGWDETGMDALLADTPTHGFFDDTSVPVFLLNPVLLDAVGHLTAFWIAQQMGTDFSSFPSRIAKIELINGTEEATAGYVLRGRLAFLEQEGQPGRFLEGNYDCLDPQGTALFRISGWRDRFFSVPNRFYFARYNPREGWYGEDWSELFATRPGTVVWVLPPFPAGFLEDAGAIWKRVLAYTVLSAEEREHWQRLPNNPKLTSEWLLNRVALKEAARYWLQQQTGVLLLPADLSIIDKADRFYVDDRGLEGLDVLPEIVLANAQGFAMAVAAYPGEALGIDLKQAGASVPTDFLASGMTPAERQQLDALPAAQQHEWMLRLWCLKEAAARSMGVELNGHANLLEVEKITENGDSVVIHAQGTMIKASVCQQDDKILALASAG